MKKNHPFFTIGSIGMVLIASLHMIFALGFSIASIHVPFFALYPIFLSFLILGFVLTVRDSKKSV